MDRVMSVAREQASATAEIDRSNAVLPCLGASLHLIRIVPYVGRGLD